MLGQIEEDGSVVLADFEAGLGTLSRMKPGQLDVALVVAEPTAKSLEVARRAFELLKERGVGRAVLVANRISAQSDRSQVAASLGMTGFTVVPDDPAIRAADAGGQAPYDTAPGAPAVRALHDLAATLVA